MSISTKCKDKCDCTNSLNTLKLFFQMCDVIFKNQTKWFECNNSQSEFSLQESNVNKVSPIFPVKRLLGNCCRIPRHWAPGRGATARLSHTQQHPGIVLIITKNISANYNGVFLNENSIITRILTQNIKRTDRISREWIITESIWVLDEP